MAEERGHRRTQRGVVVSDKTDKTVVVRVERLTRHPLYDKVLRRARKFKAHDETNGCQLGDLVVIAECRPLSREKNWRVVEILARER